MLKPKFTQPYTKALAKSLEGMNKPGLNYVRCGSLLGECKLDNGETARIYLFVTTDPLELDPRENTSHQRPLRGTKVRTATYGSKKK